jgi:hypothetical protein
MILSDHLPGAEAPVRPGAHYPRPVSTLRRTGVAAILTGLLIFAGQAGELVLGSPSDVVDAVFVALVAAGIVALGVVFWGLRTLLQGSRAGRIAAWLGLVGAALLAAFAVQAAIEVARSGEVPENFILFGLGFLLLFVAHLVLALPLRQLGIGRGWVLSPVAAAGVVVALVFDVDPVHDIGLFVFEAAWVGLGVLLLRAEHSGSAAREV